MSTHDYWALHRFVYSAFDARELAIGPPIAQQQDKFVAPITGHHVFGSHTMRQACANKSEQLIPGIMSESIVYLFEMVDVHERQSSGAQRALRKDLNPANTG